MLTVNPLNLFTEQLREHLVVEGVNWEMQEAVQQSLTVLQHSVKEDPPPVGAQDREIQTVQVMDSAVLMVVPTRVQTNLRFLLELRLILS